MSKGFQKYYTRWKNRGVPGDATWTMQYVMESGFFERMMYNAWRAGRRYGAMEHNSQCWNGYQAEIVAINRALRGAADRHWKKTWDKMVDEANDS